MIWLALWAVVGIAGMATLAFCMQCAVSRKDLVIVIAYGTMLGPLVVAVILCYLIAAGPREGWWDEPVFKRKRT